MAKFTSPPVIGMPEDTHTTAQNRLGMQAVDDYGRTWVYVQYPAAVIQGNWVSFNAAGSAPLLAANAIGPVGVAGGAGAPGSFGWACVVARNGVPARLAANCADGGRLGRETADGVAGDGRLAGDEIYNAYARSATGGTAGLGFAQIINPFVDDVNGA
jgi:hypothetical protein